MKLDVAVLVGPKQGGLCLLQDDDSEFLVEVPRSVAVDALVWMGLELPTDGPLAEPEVSPVAAPDSEAWESTYIDWLNDPAAEDDEDYFDHWGYRVFYQKSAEAGFDGEFSIREAHYSADGRVVAWSAEPMAPYGETWEELAEDVLAMAIALDQPVLKLSKDGNRLKGKKKGRK